MGVHGLIVAVVLGGFVSIVIVEVWRYQRADDRQRYDKASHDRLMRELSRHRGKR